ncbi:MAG: hypothetical protein ACI9WU_002407 [Myxococcota bacterium]
MVFALSQGVAFGDATATSGNKEDTDLQQALRVGVIATRPLRTALLRRLATADWLAVPLPGGIHNGADIIGCDVIVLVEEPGQAPGHELAAGISFPGD